MRDSAMKSMTFRFTTEAEVTLNGNCYEELYMQFKAFLHQEANALDNAEISIMPPEDSQMFVSLEGEALFEITALRGDFNRDISHNPNHIAPKTDTLGTDTIVHQ